MRLRRISLADYRNYVTAELVPAASLTVVVGANGEGKTNLLEAVGWLATTSSFRAAPGEALVREGASQAIVRGEVEQEDGRTTLVEAELRPGGRDRVLVNRQPLRRVRDLLGSFRVTVFSPDDLDLVKGAPGGRRRLLDDLLVAAFPRHDVLRADLERVLRQRNTLLRQAGGRATAEVVATLDVWDAQLAEVGEALGGARAALVEQLRPLVAAAYARVAAREADVDLRYEAPWRDVGLAAALAASRADDLRRGMGTVGPQRDDLALRLHGMPARTHASQGEQRSLALALRLAGADVVSEAVGAVPVLLLDDVFSELDPVRSQALLASLPEAQTLVTTAGALPPGAVPELVVRVREGRLLAAA